MWSADRSVGIGDHIFPVDRQPEFSKSINNLLRFRLAVLHQIRQFRLHFRVMSIDEMASEMDLISTDFGAQFDPWDEGDSGIFEARSFCFIQGLMSCRGL